MTNRCPSDLRLEAYLLDAASSGLFPHVDGCLDCQARLRRMNAEGEEFRPHPSHCWCNLSLTETGPDERPVGPEACNPSRPCFEE